MAVKAYFIDNSIYICDATENTDGSWRVTNPVLAIPSKQGLNMLPILALMEESEIVVRTSELTYGRMFTPNIELRNHYAGMFGSGIVTAAANTLNLA